MKLPRLLALLQCVEPLLLRGGEPRAVLRDRSLHVAPTERAVLASAVERVELRALALVEAGAMRLDVAGEALLQEAAKLLGGQVAEPLPLLGGEPTGEAVQRRDAMPHLLPLGGAVDAIPVPEEPAAPLRPEVAQSLDERRPLFRVEVAESLMTPPQLSPSGGGEVAPLAPGALEARLGVLLHDGRRGGGISRAGGGSPREEEQQGQEQGGDSKAHQESLPPRTCRGSSSITSTCW
jgi:hypothetical protein